MRTRPVTPPCLPELLDPKAMLGVIPAVPHVVGVWTEVSSVGATFPSPLLAGGAFAMDPMAAFSVTVRTGSTPLELKAGGGSGNVVGWPRGLGLIGDDPFFCRQA
jgi:hypothetical protein